MKDAQKEVVSSLFIRSIDAIINEKQKNPKMAKKIKNFKAKINIGLQIAPNDYLWINFISNDGKIEINRGKLERSYDLSIMAVPEDLMFFTNGEYSLFHMLFKKNKYGMRKIRFGKGTTGRNIKKILKLPKIFVMDKN
ncbi:MAG: hypothetical protein ACTSVV_19020 [Promethearchaeota archaeon]